MARSGAGFTLPEMLMVLILMGLLISVGYWGMVDAFERVKVRRTVALIAADLQYARMVAVRQHQPVVVFVDPALQKYQIRDRTGTTVYRERFVGADTEYGIDELSVMPSSSIELFPNGIAHENVTFTARIKDYMRQVRITRAGHIRVLRIEENEQY